MANNEPNMVSVPRELVERAVKVMHDHGLVGPAADLKACLPWEPDPEAIEVAYQDAGWSRADVRQLLCDLHAEGWHLTRSQYVADLEASREAWRTERLDHISLDLAAAEAEVQRLRDGIRGVVAKGTSFHRDIIITRLAALIYQHNQDNND